MEQAVGDGAARGGVARATSQLARLLLDLGADPDIKDTRFDSTPLGWARHFGQQAMIGFLQPLTRPSPAGTPDSEGSG